jgi:hypothetical protein
LPAHSTSTSTFLVHVEVLCAGNCCEKRPNNAATVVRSA